MNVKSATTRSPFGTTQTVLRSLVVGVGYVVASILLGAILAPLLPSAEGGSPFTLIVIFLCGVLFALLFGPIAIKLSLRRNTLIIVLWLMLFTIHHLSNIVEFIFFSTIPAATHLVPGILVGGADFVAAILIGMLFPPERPNVSLIEEVRSYVAQRHGSSWVWRIVVTALAYIPIYFAFGLAFSPITSPYYQDPSLGLGLAIPGFEVIIPLEFIRALWYIAVLFPVIAIVKLGKRPLALLLGTILFVPGDLVPMLEVTQWPLALRLGHGVEIFFDCFVWGAVIAHLLGPRKARP